METRKNDELILYKLDAMKEDLVDIKTDLTKRIDDQTETLHNHIESTSHVIHGNGNPGLKTTVEVLRTRVMIIWGFLATYAALIFNDYWQK
jgi:hypothetical protein